MINLIITLALILACVVLIGKGYPNQFVFLFMGILVAIGITIAGGESVANASSGNIWLDVLEAVKEGFVSSFTSTGMSMLPIYAYSSYMSKIQASQVLGDLVARPIAKSKNPYFVGIFITILICGAMRIAIVSAFAIMALFIGTLYPALQRAGISRESAISAIFIGTCFDWGPADFVIAQHISGVMAGGEVPDLTVANYFLNASIKVVPFTLLITALVGGFVMQFMDKRSGYVFGSHIPQEEAAVEHGNPAYYALLPIVPLVIVLIFSPIFMENTNLSVLAAVLISLFIVVMIEFIRKKNLKDRLKDLQTWISGLGDGFAQLLVMVIMSQFFAGMVGRLNGFKFLVDSALNAGMSGLLMVIFFGAMMFLTVFLGGGAVVGITLAQTLPGIAASMGVSYYALQLPMQLAGGFRMINIGPSVHMQYIVKTADTTPKEILKRAVPLGILMYVTTFILSMIILR